MIITAYTTDTYVPQGTDRDIRVEILTEEENPYDLTGHTVYMVLSNARLGLPPVLQKEGTIISAAEGKVVFEFVPADTIDLLTIAYSADIIVVHTESGKKWPAWGGRLGITSVVPLEEVE